MYSRGHYFILELNSWFIPYSRIEKIDGRFGHLKLIFKTKRSGMLKKHEKHPFKVEETNLFNEMG